MNVIYATTPSQAPERRDAPTCHSPALRALAVAQAPLMPACEAKTSRGGPARQSFIHSYIFREARARSQVRHGIICEIISK